MRRILDSTGKGFHASAQWAIVDDRGETIARVSQTRDGKTPGAWARWLCKIVNALPRSKSR